MFCFRNEIMKLLSLHNLAVSVACLLTAVSAQTEENTVPMLQKVAIGGGIELHYVERGKGVPIVFVHGTLGDYSTCEGLLGVFGEEYRALAYSRRYNYPNSNKVQPNDSGIVEAEDLAAFIKKLN